ncbi:unnamed protein product [Rangifer tarandus platyrhynchus]|uniref:Uncharacterized protein n=1 Tax=Rangifer tarandus platyrhynchus TaxID=3082113 RepID=A0AC59YM95_RANTA
MERPCLIIFIVLLASYVVILLHVRTRSSERQRKALSTCGSHITVVTLFFGPCIFIYLGLSTTLSVDKMVAVFYTVITPLFNSVIYSLRNTEVKKAMKSSCGSSRFMDSPRNVRVFMLGLSQNPKVHRVLFVFFLIVYLVSTGGNLLVMITIVFSPTLGSPMYIFLSCFSFIDTCYSSCMNSKLIADSLYEGRAITFKGFLAQLFVAHLLGGTEIILLTVMAYDHYVAICKPLHYTAVMTRHLCALLVRLAWLGGFLHSLVQLLLVLQLPFRRPNVTNHFVCDLYP